MNVVVRVFVTNEIDSILQYISQGNIEFNIIIENEAIVFVFKLHSAYLQIRRRKQKSCLAFFDEPLSPFHELFRLKCSSLSLSSHWLFQCCLEFQDELFI